MITTGKPDTEAEETPTATPAPPPVTREAEYPQPPERVWKALTDPGTLSQWLLPTRDFVPEPGRRFRFEDRESTTSIEGEVREAEPGQRLVYTWQAAPYLPAGRVTWTLTPTERGGTRLRITHEPEPGNDACGAMAVQASFTLHSVHGMKHCFVTSRRPGAVCMTGGRTL